jgi:hypothetical protein
MTVTQYTFEALPTKRGASSISRQASLFHSSNKANQAESSEYKHFVGAAAPNICYPLVLPHMAWCCHCYKEREWKDAASCVAATAVWAVRRNQLARSYTIALVVPATFDRELLLCLIIRAISF